MPVRFNLSLSDRYGDTIKNIKEATGISTDKEAFENAVALMLWAVRESRRGRVIGSFDEEGNYAELRMPPLDAAAEMAKSFDKPDESQKPHAHAHVHRAIRNSGRH